MSYGFVYFLTNPSMPGLTKIGHTTKHPRERVRELSASTSCPEHFELLAFFGHADSAYAEREIHRELSDFRVNDRREFFKMTNAQLQDVARCWGNPFEDAFVLDELDMLVKRDAIVVGCNG